MVTMRRCEHVSNSNTHTPQTSECYNIAQHLCKHLLILGANQQDYSHRYVLVWLWNIKLDLSGVVIDSQVLRVNFNTCCNWLSKLESQFHKFRNWLSKLESQLQTFWNWLSSFESQLQNVWNWLPKLESQLQYHLIRKSHYFQNLQYISTGFTHKIKPHLQLCLAFMIKFLQ